MVACQAGRVSVCRLSDQVHADVRWAKGGIGRFSHEVLRRVMGGGRRLGGRFRLSRPTGGFEMAARFTPLGVRGGLLFSPGFAPPFGWEPRTIVTVHDLHYLDPAITTPSGAFYFGRVVVPQLRRCRLVLTVSEHSAGELRSALGPGGPEVVVVGNGVEGVFVEPSEVPLAATPRLLFVGGDKTNKNLHAALRAVDAVARRSPIELVVVGAVAETVRASAPPAVSFVGSVDDARLAELYASSTALLMPSMAEGFGLPALESLVAGTPVVYGDRGALPDLVGQWGWPVDPFDDDSIVSAIVSAIDAPIVVEPSHRRALADRYRWDAVADRVVSAIEAVL